MNVIDHFTQRPNNTDSGHRKMTNFPQLKVHWE